jgi:hypothetical protein
MKAKLMIRSSEFNTSFGLAIPIQAPEDFTSPATV